MKIKSTLKLKRDINSYEKIYVIISILLFSAYLFTRFSMINHSLWHDEIWSLENYILKGFNGVVNPVEYRPNDHIAYNLIVLFLIKIFGFSEIIVRLPSILFAALGFLIYYIYSNKYIGKLSSIFFLILGTFYAEHSIWIPQSRSYGLLILTSGLLMHLTYKLLTDKVQNKYFMQITMISFIGIYSFPLYIVYVFGVYILLMSVDFKKTLLAGMSLITSLSIAYFPIIKGLMKFYGVKEGMKTANFPEWHAFITYPIKNVTRDKTLISNFSRINYGNAITLMILIFILISVFILIQKNKSLLKVIIFPSTLFYIIVSILSIPALKHSRYTIYMNFNYIFLMSIGMDASFRYLFNNIRHKKNVISFFCLVLIAIMSLTMIYSEWEEMSKLKVTPIENFKGAFLIIKENLKDSNYKLAVSTISPDFNFDFYSREILNKEDIHYIGNSLYALNYLNKEGKVIVIDHVFSKDPLIYKGKKELATIKQRRGYLKIYEFEEAEVSSNKEINKEIIEAKNIKYFDINEKIVKGKVDVIEDKENYIYFLGWALDNENKKSVEEIIFINNGEIIYSTKPKGNRKDVEKIYNVKTTGWTAKIKIPQSQIENIEIYSLIDNNQAYRIKMNNTMKALNGTSVELH